MISLPETRYAKSGDTYIAYQIMGNGPFDLVLVPGFITHLDMQMELAPYASFMARLASFCRLIRFDKRGTGLSDRLTRRERDPPLSRSTRRQRQFQAASRQPALPTILITAPRRTRPSAPRRQLSYWTPMR